jgi:hypothetical protein
MKTHAPCVPLIVGLMAAALGCTGGNMPRRFDVTGTVTLNGQPLPEGSVRFQPTGTGGRPEGASIRDGRFSLQAVEGSYHVVISVPRPVEPKRVLKDMGPSFVEALPARYNTATTLTADVKPEGPNDFLFELHAGP